MQNIRSLEMPDAGEVLKCTWDKALCFLLAALLFWASSYANRTYEEMLANKPTSIVRSLWVTPQASVVAALSNTSGVPNTEVPIEDFKTLIGDRAYEVFYKKGWQNNEPMCSYSYVSGENVSASCGAIMYQAKIVQGPIEKYLVAYERIPVRLNTLYGWKFTTAFDQQKGEFSSVATTLSSSWYDTWWRERLLAFGLLAVLIVVSGIQIYRFSSHDRS